MKKSYKILKLERNRSSILTDDLEHCYICKDRANALHEIYFGKNRQNSMKRGCVIPLCQEHHLGASGVHLNRDLDIKIKRICQKKFMELNNSTIDEFIKIFGRNYL